MGDDSGRVERFEIPDTLGFCSRAAGPLAWSEGRSDAFVENFVGVIGSGRTLGARNRVRETKVVEELAEVDWMELHVELLVDEMLYLLFLPRLTVSEKFEQFLLFISAELRGRPAPEVRRQLSKTSFVPPTYPTTAG